MTAPLVLVKPELSCEYDAHVALWIVRLSIGTDAALRQFVGDSGCEDVRQLIGIEPIHGRIPRSECRALLKIRLTEFQKKMPAHKEALFRNIKMLGELLQFDTTQQELLAFVALSQHHPLLREFIDSIRNNTMEAIARFLSIVLTIGASEIKRVIAPGSQLLATRVIQFGRNSYGSGLQLTIMEELLKALFTPHANLKMLMGTFIENAPRPILKETNFPHLVEETRLLIAYLSKTHKKKTRGVNILIYGAPGTGKTEYVRWLASRLRKPLYQVKSADEEGSPIDGSERLIFFQFCQQFLNQADALVLFDEMEDVFPQNQNLFNMVRNSRTGGISKSWLNELLTQNSVPSIWISNAVDHIDKAYLRRFDFSFEMGIPPASVRAGILKKYLDPFNISSDVITHLSHQESLSPAQIEKGAKLLTVSGHRAQDQAGVLACVIGNSMALLQQEDSSHSIDWADCHYRLEYLHANCDLTKLVSQLKSSPAAHGAICLYGPPGTGKTAFAHFLSKEMALPLMVRRASDILDAYVGVTEQKIAEMFKLAEREKTVLLLDEADSFLSERKGARASWEVTMVNEMLTQMENFDGLFICSTNLMSKLDEASLRRFALKIKFDYLQPEQRWRLFAEQVKKIAQSKAAPYRAALNQMNNLTPGDFATVRRQGTLLGETLSAEEFLNRLKQETKSKPDGGKRSIGFI